MTYLLDVNTLIGLALYDHVFHTRVECWVVSLKDKKDTLASTPITELAFVRIITQLPDIKPSVVDANDLLTQLKARSCIPFVFIADDQEANKLPIWVKTAKQTTDGHLAELAIAHGAILATLDHKIPRSFLIPSLA